MRLVAIATLVALGCQSAPPPASEQEPGRGAALSMREPGEDVRALAVDLVGSCAFARPPGEAARYTVPVAVRSGGGAVYATADLSDDANRIGRLRGGSNAMAEGPLAGGRGAGSGYALVLLDAETRVCRGYVSSALIIER